MSFSPPVSSSSSSGDSDIVPSHRDGRVVLLSRHHLTRTIRNDKTAQRLRAQYMLGQLSSEQVIQEMERTHEDNFWLYKNHEWVKASSQQIHHEIRVMLFEPLPRVLPKVDCQAPPVVSRYSSPTPINEDSQMQQQNHAKADQGMGSLNVEHAKAVHDMGSLNVEYIRGSLPSNRMAGHKRDRSSLSVRFALAGQECDDNPMPLAHRSFANPAAGVSAPDYKHPLAAVSTDSQEDDQPNIDPSSASTSTHGGSSPLEDCPYDEDPFV